MWKLFFKGGVMMYPIIICSILSLAIIFERFYFYFKSDQDPEKLIDMLRDLLKRNKVKDALEVCDKKLTPLSQVVKAGILKFENTKEIIKEAMEDASLYEIPKLERNLSFLATIAHISPLLGLLGTVLGLVRCFHTIEVKVAQFGSIAPSDLAGGIWEALITTVAGLIVAIPTYVAYNYFVHRVNFYTLEMERTASEVLHVLTSEEI